jgi:YVTN family beta-propeller protein
MKLVSLDATTWEVTGETPLFAWPRVLAVSADGSRVFQTIRWLNGALVIDPDRQAVVDRIALGEPAFAAEGKDAHGLAVTPDGSELWLTTQSTNDVTIFDAEELTILGRIYVGRNPNWVDFSPDGRLAIVSNTGSNDASIIDVADRKIVATVDVGPSPKRLDVGTVAVESSSSSIR